MKVTEQFIASLLARIDLVELINKRINLRKVGANFIGLCPFHQEKTPSFTVNTEKQFFHCFGCKKSGDAIQFVMDLERKSFVDTVETLANNYGLYLEKSSSIIKKVDPLLEKIYNILAITASFYHEELFKNNPISKNALKYLTDRGINLATIKQFNIGFASPGWTNIIDFLNKQSFDLVDLKQAGLVVEKNDKCYDRFRLRIIFPIKNKFAQVIGFGARALSVEQTPKYLNSPETLAFKKNQELYGLDIAKTVLKNIDNLIVVEGYVDVLTLVQSGISNVVATLGTAFSEYHLKNIFNLTSEIIFCFDGDLAGYKATVRVMELSMRMLANELISNKQTIKFVLLPNNYDPDLLIRKKGIKEFQSCLQNAMTLSDFFFDYLAKKYPEKTIENLNKLAQEGKLYISKIKDALLQNLWYEKLANFLGVDSNSFKQQNNNKISKNKFINNTNNANKNNYNYLISNAYRILAILLIEPGMLPYCRVLEDEQFSNLKLSFELELLIKIIRILERLGSKAITVEELAFHLEPVYAQKLLLIDIKKIVQNIPREGIEQELLGAVKNIKRELIGYKVDDLLNLAKIRNLEKQEKLLLQQILKEL